MKTLSLAVILVFSTFCLVAGALAASDTANLTIKATVKARAKLVLSVNTLNFQDADPDTTSSIAADEGTVTVSVKVRTGGTSVSTLIHRAAGDLVDGANTIPVSNITWTATGPGFVDGTMSKDSDVIAGSWTGPGNDDGTFSYFLTNSWDYEIGSYAASSTYTVTVP